MDRLSNLKYAKGSIKNRKRVARGFGSGHGKTATRGMNGQMSRSGAKSKAWFEGGQMPLQRRVPKFGFTNHFKKEFQLINVDSLQILVDRKIEIANIDILKENGLISSKRIPVKILGNGEIKGKITVEANAFSKSAIEKIQAAGGSINKL